MSMKVDFDIINLKKGERKQFYFSEKEAGIVFLSGSCSVSFETGEVFQSVGDRNTVFEKPGYAVYIPKDTRADFEAITDEISLAVISTDAKNKRKPFVVNPDNISGQVRGKKEWKRTVYDLFNDSTDSLYIGETYHTDGVWSGYPPHKHDTDIEGYESKNEEIYFVKVKPDNGFGVFINYTKKEEKKSRIVSDNDILYVKEGYHAIVSAPGFDFYYLWALSSKDRKFICSQDDDYNWIEE